MDLRKLLLVIVSILNFILLSGQQTIININTTKPGAAISKNLYGIFFEEINHAGEGGIYGEILQNRGMEANRLPENMLRIGSELTTKQGWKHYYPQPDSLVGWSLVVKGGAQGNIKQVSENPLNLNNPMSMKISVNKLANGELQIINKGFWGISLIKGDNYLLSLYARSADQFKGEIAVVLQAKDGKVLSKEIIKSIGNGWGKYSCRLNANITDTNAQLAIVPLSEGTLWIDMVSMFPEKTYKNRPNGMRLDLANKIEDFKPGFIRFPGGCIVEGATLANRVRWKNTIGDISKRPGHWVLWDYHSTDGMGFHEYLQFCEDLKCPAMYVISIGMSCQFRKTEIVDTSLLQPYVDEVMDALEYALGPVSSKWGSERAKNGHPEPFNLKYVEVGNENYGPVYQSHYNFFYRAIKEKYPKITTITCTDPGMRESFKRSDLEGIKEPIEMIDEHFYESTDFFYKNAYRYDSYDRNGPKLYVGEYAVKKWDNSLTGNLDAALAEAAFMTGMERNADIIELTSQAPTFVNVNDRNWNPDLLVYNSSQSFGTPSYQVQKLFSNYIPDNLLPVEVINSGYKVNAIEKGKGMIGFNNPKDNCIYKEIKVKIDNREFTPNELFAEESLQKISNEGLRIGKNDFVELLMKPDVYKYAETNNWKDYTLTLKAKADTIGDIEGFTVFFYTTGWKKCYKWNIGRWLRYNWLQWYDNGYESYFGQAPGTIEAGRWYDISITVKNDSVFCSLDGKLIHAVKVPQLVTPGIYASSGIKSNGDIILKIVNPTDEVKQIPISINNSMVIFKNIHAESISGGRYDENSFSEPFKVSPKGSDFQIPGNSFVYSTEARSVTVLTIKK
jgi:alpha-L-arabinofuranosidase